MLVTNPKFQPPSCDLPSVVCEKGDDIHIILPLVGLAEPFKVISQAAHFILRMRKLRAQKIFSQRPKAITRTLLPPMTRQWRSLFG